MRKNKKGQMAGAVGALLTLGIGIMVLGIALSFGLNITGDLKTDFLAGETETATCNATSGIATGCGYAYNGSRDAQLGMANVTSKTPTIAKVGVAVVIIGLIVTGFGVYFMKR